MADEKTMAWNGEPVTEEEFYKRLIVEFDLLECPRGCGSYVADLEDHLAECDA